MIFLENQMYVGGTIAQKSNKDSLIFTFLYRISSIKALGAYFFLF